MKYLLILLAIIAVVIFLINLPFPMRSESMPYAVYLPCVGIGCAGPPANAETPLPDLYAPYHYRVNYFGCPWGSPGEIIVWVHNAGPGDAGAFQVKINNISIAQVEGVAAGTYQKARVTFESGPVGGILVEADYRCQVYESNEANNGFNLLFTPPSALRNAVSGAVK